MRIPILGTTRMPAPQALSPGRPRDGPGHLACDTHLVLVECEEGRFGRYHLVDL